MSRVDYLIIGAGPAGLQLAYFLAKSGRDYLVLEREAAAGSFFTKFPRHRQLISANKLHTGSNDPEIRLRFDWNSLLGDSNDDLFRRYSREYFPHASAIVRYLDDFTVRHSLKIRYSTPVVSILDGETFAVRDDTGNVYEARCLVLATGFSKPHLPSIPGVELTEKYEDVSVNPQDFVNQRVLIIGKGNSAFETADNLVSTAALIHLASPSPLNFAWKTHFVGHLRAVNNNVLDTYQLKLQNAILDATIERISRRRDGKLVVSVRYSHAHGEAEDLAYDRVITCTGFRFDATVFDEGCRPELTLGGRFPSQTSAWESTNIRNLFFAGTLMQVRDFKKSSSGFIHGFRYNVRTLHNLLEHRFHGRPLRHRTIEDSPEALTAAVMARINRSSALWQQFGFLADVVEVRPGSEGAGYYEELPVDYVRDSKFAREEHYTVTLEFGPSEGDPFNVLRYPDPLHAERSTFLHPVIRHFVASELVGQVHLLENLFGEWADPELHVGRMLAFFRSEARQVEPGEPLAVA